MKIANSILVALMSGTAKVPLDSVALFRIGRAIGFLQQARQGDTVVHPDGSEEKPGKVLLLAMIRKLVMDLEKYNLCPREAGFLRQFADRLSESRGGNLGRPSPRPTLTQPELVELRTLVEMVLSVVSSKVGERSFSETIPSGGAFDYVQLGREGIHALLPATGPIESMPAGVQQDLTGAVHALCSDIPTGAGMLALRATEGMVRYTYERLFSKAATGMDWAKLADEICDAQKARGENPTQLRGYLDYMRVVRNSAQHPGRRFELREAEDALRDAVRAAVLLQALSSEPRAEKSAAPA